MPHCIQTNSLINTFAWGHPKLFFGIFIGQLSITKMISNVDHDSINKISETLNWLFIELGNKAGVYWLFI